MIRKILTALLITIANIPILQSNHEPPVLSQKHLLELESEQSVKKAKTKNNEDKNLEYDDSAQEIRDKIEPKLSDVQEVVNQQRLSLNLLASDFKVLRETILKKIDDINQLIRNEQLSQQIHQPDILSLEVSGNAQNKPTQATKTSIITPNDAQNSLGHIVKAPNKSPLLTTSEPTKKLTGHTGTINSVAFSSDGKFVLSGSSDNTARLWNLATNDIKELKGHTNYVTSVAFSPDGKYALTGSADTTARYWDLNTSKTIKVLMGHTDIISSVAFSRDGKYVLTGSWDKTARLWDPVTGKNIKIFMGHTREVTSVAFSPDDNYALTGSPDKTTRYWDLNTGQAIKVLGDIDSITSVAFSPAGNYALIGSSDKKARYRNLVTDEIIKVLVGHTDVVRSVALSPYGDYALTGSWDKTARLWDLATGETIKVLKDHKDSVISVVFSPDGKLIATGSCDKKIIVYNLQNIIKDAQQATNRSTNCLPPIAAKIQAQETISTKRLFDEGTGEEIKVLKGHTGGVISLLFSPDGISILTGSEDQTTRYWNLNTKAISAHILHTNCANINSIAFSPDGKYVLTGSYANIACYSNLSLGKVINMLIGHTNYVTSVAFSPDGNYALTGSYDNTARYWDLNTGKTRIVLKEHSDSLTSVAFSPDGKYALTGSWDKTARYWDLVTGETLKVLKGHADNITSVAFSPDGKCALTGSLDKTALYWDLNTGKAIKTLSGHTNYVTAVGFSSCGTYALTGSSDNTARFWDLNSGKTLKVLVGHTDSIKSIAFSSDGKLIATGSADTKVIIYNFQNIIGKTQPVAVSNNSNSILLKMPANVLVPQAAKGMASLLTQQTLSLPKNSDIDNKQKGKAHILVEPKSRDIVVLDEDDEIADSMDTSTNNSNAKPKDKATTAPRAQAAEENIVFNKQNLKAQAIANTATDKHNCLFLKGHTDCISGLCFDKKTNSIISSSRDKTIKIWNAQTGECKVTLTDYKNPITALCNNMENGIIASAEANTKEIKLWTLGTSQWITGICLRNLETGKSFSQAPKDITALCYAGNDLIAATGTQLIVFTDCFMGPVSTRLMRIRNLHKNDITSICYNSLNKQLIAGSKDCIVRGISLDSGEFKELGSGENLHTDFTMAVCFDAEHNRIVTASADKTIMLWNALTGKHLKTLKGHDASVTCLCVIPAYDLVISGSTDKKVKIWNADSGNCLYTFTEHTSDIRALCFDSNNNRIISAAQNVIITWPLLERPTVNEHEKYSLN